MATVIPIQPGETGDERDAARRAELLSHVYTLDEMLARPTEQAEALLGNFLRKGEVTLLGGHGGQGKSTMGLRMMGAAVTGNKFLGARGEGVRGLIVDLEQGVGVAQRAVMRAFYPTGYEEGVPVPDLIEDMELGDLAKRIRYADWRQGSVIEDWSLVFGVIEELIELHQPDLIMIDPVYKLFLGANVNEGEVVGRLISHIDSIRSRHPVVSWLIPMHPRKPPQMGEKVPSMHDLYGSAMWGWWAGQIFTIQRTTGNGATFRICKDRMGLLEPEDWTLTLDRTKGYQRAVGDIGEDGPRTPEEKIYRLLQDVTPQRLTRKEMGNLLSLHHKTVIRATVKIAEQMTHGRYSGMVIDSGGNRTLYYGYAPNEQDVVIDQIKQAFGASEEDE